MGVLVVDAQGFVAQANEQAVKLLSGGAITPEQFLGRFSFLEPGLFSDVSLAAQWRGLRRGEALRVETDLRSLSGRTCCVELFGTRVDEDSEYTLLVLVRELPSGRASGAVPEGSDAQSRARALNQRILAAVPGGIVQVAQSGAILDANPEARRILGLRFDSVEQSYSTDFGAKTLWEDGSPCPLDEYPVTRCLATGAAQPPTTIGVQRSGGSVAWAVFTAIPLRDPATGLQDGAVVTFLDVTAHKDSEGRLRAALRERELLMRQKLESLGVLFGGIAHDFNNLLTIMLGRLAMARGQVHEPDSAERHLAAAARAGQQAQGLMQQLLSFSKSGDPVRRPTHLDAFLRDTIATALADATCSWEVETSEHLWMVEIDRSQMSQVFRNLALNAAQSMSGRMPPGRVTVSVDNARVDVRSHLPLGPGRYVRVRVRDEGVGISEADLRHIFDAYFTTKESGSGLGLAVAHSIVVNHGGHIGAASGDGEGSEFTVHLPASDAEEESTHAVVAPVLRAGERILVMDDEPEVRNVLGAMLEILGYGVGYAKDGAEAVAAYATAISDGRPYDAVILDLVVPSGLGGQEALAALRSRHPDVRAIISSGYSADPAMNRPTDFGFKAFLPKPFDLTCLQQILLDVLA